MNEGGGRFLVPVPGLCGMDCEAGGRFLAWGVFCGVWEWWVFDGSALALVGVKAF